MNNLRRFNTYADYSAATLNYPAVSWVVSGDTVYFDKAAPMPTCLPPSSATTYNVDENFDFTKPVYELGFELLKILPEHSGDGDVASTNIFDSANTQYIVDCVYYSDSDSWDLTVSDRLGNIIYTGDTSSFNCCDVFGQPMYLDENMIPMIQTCDGYECTEYECLNWDEETGECIEQGDCINSECTQGYTDNYVLEVLA